MYLGAAYVHTYLGIDEVTCDSKTMLPSSHLRNMEQILRGGLSHWQKSVKNKDDNILCAFDNTRGERCRWRNSIAEQ